jgi:hypothetical protein
MLLGEGVDLVVVNDQGFPDLKAMVATPDLLHAFVPSPTADEILRLDTTTGAVSGMPVGDGPNALSLAKLGGIEQVVVAHRYAKELRVITARPDAKGQHSQRTLPAPDRVLSMSVQDGMALVLEGRTRTVVAIALKDGAELWRSVPLPGTTQLKTMLRFVVASGPNRSIAVLDSKTGARVQADDLEEIADEVADLGAVMDEWRHRAYEADLGEDILRVSDTNGKVPRASVRLPAPSALALSQDGQWLLVLERFAGKIARLDLRSDQPKVAKELQLVDPPAQADRRRGEILFFQGKQSCASCHPEGQGARGARDLAAALASPIHLAAPKDADTLRQLAAYVRGLTALPSPWRGAEGGLLPTLALPDARTGTPDLGRRVFLTSCAKANEFADLAALFDRARETPASKVLERCPDLDAQSRADVEAFVLSL